MLFSYAVRAVYVESCTMFTRGGVYRVVKGAVGGGVAKLSVSALMFDYILTGPISAVSAGQYLVGLFGDMLKLITAPLRPPHHLRRHHPQGRRQHPDGADRRRHHDLLLARQHHRHARVQRQGPADHAAHHRDGRRDHRLERVHAGPPPQRPARTALHAPPLHPVFTGGIRPAGWPGCPRIVGALGIMIAFGHSLLAMSGEESLAQVNREIEAPKLKNLKRAGFVIFVYSMLLTSLISFLAVLHHPRRQARRHLRRARRPIACRQAAEVEYRRRSITCARATPARTWGYELHRQTDKERPRSPTHRPRGRPRHRLPRRARRRRLPRQPHQRPGPIPRRPQVAQDRHGGVRRDRRLPDPGRRRQHQHGRVQRRAEPPGRGRRPHPLVPAPPAALRHHPPPDQPDRDPAAPGDRRQPRRRQHAGRGVRLRRRLVVRLHDACRWACCASTTAAPGSTRCRSTSASPGGPRPRRTAGARRATLPGDRPTDNLGQAGRAGQPGGPRRRRRAQARRPGVDGRRPTYLPNGQQGDASTPTTWTCRSASSRSS